MPLWSPCFSSDYMFLLCASTVWQSLFLLLFSPSVCKFLFYTSTLKIIYPLIVSKSLSLSTTLFYAVHLRWLYVFIVYVFLFLLLLLYFSGACMFLLVCTCTLTIRPCCLHAYRPPTHTYCLHHVPAILHNYVDWMPLPFFRVCVFYTPLLSTHFASGPHLHDKMCLYPDCRIIGNKRTTNMIAWAFCHRGTFLCFMFFVCLGILWPLLPALWMQSHLN